MRRQGIRIGSYQSGLIGNLAQDEIDHILTQKYGARVVRNSDDMVILARSKAEARFLLNVYSRLAEERGLTVKASARLRPVTEGIDFLGFVMTPDNVRVRKQIKRSFAKGMARVRSRRRRRELAASYKGWCMYGHGQNLYNKVMGFKAKGIEVSPKTINGQKFFDVRCVQINDILNVPVDVLDYQPCISTRDIKDGTKRNGDRYVVLLRVRETGGEVKLITNAMGIKAVLDQCGERENAGEKIFPVEDVMIQKRSIGGGKKTYKFIDL